MFGFLIGTACLVGLFSTLKRGPYGCGSRMAFGGFRGGWEGHGRRGFGHFGDFGHGHGRGYGYGDDAPDARDGVGPRGGFFGGRFGGGFGGRYGRDPFVFLRYAFRVLDTTPGQEKVLRETARDLWDRSRTVKDDVREARRGFAGAIREESFDEVALGNATAKLEEATEAMRKAVIDALAKAHGVLDERQRRILADFIESGPEAFARGFGGYRERDDDDRDARGPRDGGRS